MRPLLSATGVFLVIVLCGCAARMPALRAARSLPRPASESAPSATEHGAVTGRASYYGGRFHGRRTASGARFDQNAMTAAHRTLPFGTLLKVTNLSNRRSVLVRVTDRGPFIKGRIIDLSKGAARQLGFLRKGIAEVRLEPLEH